MLTQQDMLPGLPERVPGVHGGGQEGLPSLPPPRTSTTPFGLRHSYQEGQRQGGCGRQPLGRALQPQSASLLWATYIFITLGLSSWVVQF